MTNDRIREYIRELRKQSLASQHPQLRDTLRRMEAELGAPPRKHYDATDPEHPWLPGTER